MWEFDSLEFREAEVRPHNNPLTSFHWGKWSSTPSSLVLSAVALLSLRLCFLLAAYEPHANLNKYQDYLSKLDRSQVVYVLS